MFFGYNNNYPMWIVLFMLLIVVASVVVPIYGHRRKGWKGLALGCLAQPVVCIIVIFTACISIFIYERWELKKQKDKAMVTVRTLEKKGDRVDTLFWYVKPDEECIMERKRQGHGNDDEEDRDSTENSRDFEWFDVVPIENFAHGINIEDRIMIRFDLKNHSVVATDYDDRAEVTKVDWDQVRNFFNKK